jgi:adenine-specific DNA-methyltransferase
MPLQVAGKIVTGELAALVGIEDFRSAIKNEGRKIKFILVQLPEPLLATAQIADGGPRNVADVAINRLRIDTEREGQRLLAGKVDAGFRTFKLSQSCFHSWSGQSQDISNAELLLRIESHAEHLNPSASSEEILFEVLLKDGFQLTVPIQQLELIGKQVFSIADGALLVCLEKQLTQEVIDGMAELEPSRVICLDAGFQGNDQLKANAVQTFKARARNRETAIEFRTV